MTVCICVSSTKRCRGCCAFGNGLCVCLHRRACVWECICAYVCLLIIHGYFFQTESYALFCMIYSHMSQAAGLFFMRERERRRLWIEPEWWGLRDNTVNRPQQGAVHHSLLQLFMIQPVSLSAKGARCKLSAKKSFFAHFLHVNFLIKRKWINEYRDQGKVTSNHLVNSDWASRVEKCL